jgi:ssDNA-binding Zn-finger/Zn-ribbon topoisomerase 1
MVGMPKGRCPRCGFEYCGGALHNPRHQTCTKCGEALIIIDSDGAIFEGHSPFNTKGHLLRPPNKAVHTDEGAKSTPEKGKDSAVKDG